MAQFIGFAFPFQKGTSEFPESATDAELIKQALVQLVLTGTGERVMRPDFGGSAYRYVFEDNDIVLQQLVETELFFLIARYEPRVSVVSIEAVRGDQLDTATKSENEASSVVITISYIILSTRSPDQLTITLTGGG